MIQNKEKIHSFTDLVAWKDSHKLAIMIYEATKSFPKEEIFGLTNQIRRASVSVVSNIAEDFSRSSAKEKIQFYSVSLGSLTEVQSQLFIARDIQYINKEGFDRILEQTITVSKLCNGLIKKSRSTIIP
ncbi:MAG: four helix bundle protein [bacterium]|nr:four helix bundle protein [bacterium]